MFIFSYIVLLPYIFILSKEGLYSSLATFYIFILKFYELLSWLSSSITQRFNLQFVFVKSSTRKSASCFTFLKAFLLMEADFFANKGLSYFYSGYSDSASSCIIAFFRSLTLCLYYYYESSSNFLLSPSRNKFEVFCSYCEWKKWQCKFLQK